MTTARKGIDRQHLIKTYMDVRNITLTAEALGISFNTCKYHLKQAGLETLPAKPRPATPWTGLSSKARYKPTIQGRIFKQFQM